MASKRQSGQAMILALALLGIGALITVPALTLTDISLKRSQLASEQARDFYAADAGQEYAMWKLKDADFLSQFEEDGDSSEFQVDVCGSTVNVEVVLKATPTWLGVTLIKDAPILPSKSVTGPVGGVYTYTISLEQISSNTSDGLDAIYDILPGFTAKNGSFGTTYYDYVSGSSRLSADGGQTWSVISNPSVTKSGTSTMLQWPAAYNPDTGTGSFTPPISDFEAGQIKKLEFQVKPSNMANNTKFYNWVVLKPWNTTSGPEAPIIKGTGSNLKSGFLNVDKQPSQAIVPSGEPTLITYTVTITNLSGANDKIETITDYLPPGFTYVGNPTGLPPPSKYTVTEFTQIVNGVERNVVEWEFNPDWAITRTQPGNFLQFTFQVLASGVESGSYYNELVLTSNDDPVSLFADIGVNDEDFSSGYTWNNGPVTVPYYDIRTTSGRGTLQAFVAITASGSSFVSYHVK